MSQEEVKKFDQGESIVLFYLNLHAESQGRLQAVRMYEMTDDRESEIPLAS